MNTYQMENPEAFQAEYEDEQRVLRQLAEENALIMAANIALVGLLLDVAIARLDAELSERGEDVDLFDLVREHDEDEDEPYAPDEDERDGDAASALASAGFGTDEDYGGDTHDWEDGGEW